MNTGAEVRPLPALGAYAALSVLLTWPLALGLGRDVPADLGDSLLNMWILAWGADHVPRLLAGSLAWRDFWNANIFHPDPLALTFSEHLVGQALQILPVYWLTGNIILCYNLLFISTFALSAFGAYLLARDLTGDDRAALLAGLVYGFLPYRIASMPHLQVMSSQWMPFALYGLNRFVGTNSRLALAGGTGALVLQNWSCGYYLLYFAPFVPLFLLHRLWTTGRWKDPSVWLWLGTASAVTFALTLPFLFPYLEAQQRYGFERPYGEVLFFSANIWSYITAAEPVRLWGSVLRFHPYGERETFLGFVPWLLAGLAVWRARVADPSPPSRLRQPPSPRPCRSAEASRGGGGHGGRASPLWRQILSGVLGPLVVLQFVALAGAILVGGIEIRVLGVPIAARSPGRLLLQLVGATALLLIASPGTRQTAARLARAAPVLSLAAAVLAMWLSLGPDVKAGDRSVPGMGLYGVLYEHVPGFKGVRVPARYAMIAGLFLAVAAGCGASAFRARRWGTALTVAAGVLILAEGAAIPLELNHAWGQHEATPPSRVYPASQAPPVYARLARLPAGTVVTEFPFGDAAWEIRYVYYSAAHWKPITNGYSGAFPPAYSRNVARLQKPHQNPEAAWQALVDTGTTHVVVHDAAFADARDAIAVRQWLLAFGATPVEDFAGGDTLFALP